MEEDNYDPKEADAHKMSTSSCAASDTLINVTPSSSGSASSNTDDAKLPGDDDMTLLVKGDLSKIRAARKNSSGADSLIRNAIAEALDVAKTEDGPNGLYFHAGLMCACFWSDDLPASAARKQQQQSQQMYAGKGAAPRGEIEVLAFGVVDPDTLEDSAGMANAGTSSKSPRPAGGSRWRWVNVRRSELVQMVDTHVDVLVANMLLSSAGTDKRDEVHALEDNRRILAFLYALLDFVYWDNTLMGEASVYYTLPVFVCRDLIGNEANCMTWLKEADKLGQQGMYRYCYDFDQERALAKRAFSYYEKHVQSWPCIIVREFAHDPDIFRMRQMFCLLLCATHIGLEDEFKLHKEGECPGAVSQWNSDAAQIACSKEFFFLLQQSRDHYVDIMKDTDDECSNASEEDEVDVPGVDHFALESVHGEMIHLNSEKTSRCRSESSILAYSRFGARIGSNYQVDVEPFTDRVKSTVVVDSQNSLVFAPDSESVSEKAGDESDDEFVLATGDISAKSTIDHFLSQVKLLRHAVPGQIVEAPPCPLTTRLQTNGPAQSSTLTDNVLVGTITPDKSVNYMGVSSCYSPSATIVDSRRGVDTRAADVKADFASLGTGVGLLGASPGWTEQQNLKSPARVRKLNNHRSMVICVVLQLDSIETNGTATGASSEGAAVRAVSTRFVTVTDGFEQWTVPLSSCRLVTLPEDAALEILYRNKFDITKALVEVGVKVCGKVADSVDVSKDLYRQVNKLWTPHHLKLLKCRGDQFFDNPIGFYRDLMKHIAVSKTMRSLNKQFPAKNTDSMDPSAGAASSVVAASSAPLYSWADVVDVFSRSFQTDSDYMYYRNRIGGSQQSYNLAISTSSSSSSATKSTAANSNSELSGNFNEVVASFKKSIALNLSCLASPLTGSSELKRLLSESYTNEFSNLWPYSVLPMSVHGIYWLKRSSCPCLCTGLDVQAYRNSLSTSSGTHIPSIVYMKVVPIDCATPRRVTLVSPSMLEPYQTQPSGSVINLLLEGWGSSGSRSLEVLSQDTGDKSSSTSGGSLQLPVTTSSPHVQSLRGGGGLGPAMTASKTADFVGAMIDFCVCKLLLRLKRMQKSLDAPSAATSGVVKGLYTDSPSLSKHETSLCAWFHYPAFIRDFFDESSSWSSWRKSAERRVVYAAASGDQQGNVHLKLSRREQYFFSLIESDAIIIEEQHRYLLHKAKISGIIGANCAADSAAASPTLNGMTPGLSKYVDSNLSKYINSFEWGEELYVMQSFPWDDDLMYVHVKEDPPAAVEEIADSEGAVAQAEADISSGAHKASTGVPQASETDIKGGSNRDYKKKKENQLNKVDSGSDATRNNSKKGKEQAVEVVKASGKRKLATDLTGLTKVEGEEKKTKKKVEVVTKPVVPIVEKPDPRMSLMNLYWHDRLRLPCVFYDNEDKYFADKFYVIPLCCETYHYYALVQRSQVVPLTETNVGWCNDERTRDFGGALLDFAAWDATRNTSLGHTREVDGKVQPYEWPVFILDMITQPKVWASWRKKHDRSIMASTSGGSSLRAETNTRRSVYFRALRDEMIAFIDAKNEP